MALNSFAPLILLGDSVKNSLDSTSSPFMQSQVPAVFVHPAMWPMTSIPWTGMQEEVQGEVHMVCTDVAAGESSLQVEGHTHKPQRRGGRRRKNKCAPPSPSEDSQLLAGFMHPAAWVCPDMQGEGDSQPPAGFMHPTAWADMQGEADSQLPAGFMHPTAFADMQEETAVPASESLEQAQDSTHRPRRRGGRRRKGKGKGECDSPSCDMESSTPGTSEAVTFSGAGKPARVGLQQWQEGSSKTQEQQQAECDPSADSLSCLLQKDSLEHGEDVQKQLKAAMPKEEKEKILERLLEHAAALALKVHGCRVVQVALDVAGVTYIRKLLESLQSHVVELYESMHGNFVLARLIEKVPAANLGGVLAQLQAKGFEEVATHRYGCRVFERLIEHCTERDLQGLISEVLCKAEKLSQHPYGNFVVQHLLEHSISYRSQLLKAILPYIPKLSRDRNGSHVVQRALSYSDQAGQRKIVSELLAASGENSLKAIAQNRYGSFVVEQLQELGGDEESPAAGVRESLEAGLSEILQTQFGVRVAETYGLWHQTSLEHEVSLGA